MLCSLIDGLAVGRLLHPSGKIKLLVPDPAKQQDHDEPLQKGVLDPDCAGIGEDVAGFVGDLAGDRRSAAPTDP